LPYLFHQHPGGKLNLTANPYIEYSNHASGQIIFLLSLGSIQKEKSSQSPVTDKNLTSIEVLDIKKHPIEIPHLQRNSKNHRK
jgi:hypothetical protein